MMLTATDRDNERKLKAALHAESDASKLERLAAALVGQLLGVTVAVAQSGFQHGGDAGPAGRQGRRLRLECKKYSATTSFSERELLGELDHALARDAALEAWILVATREVPEQIEQSLVQKGELIGVPVLILDWKPAELASLAALCASAPNLVAAEFSAEAGVHARALQPVSTEALDRLRRDFQSWSLGFNALRAESLTRLEKIWNSPKASNAALGQNAAGGAQDRKVRRDAAHDGLTTWWRDAAQRDAPVAVVGYEGVGKTWATLDWLVDHKDEQPIILIVPSSTAVEFTGSSETAIKRFLADRLHELAQVRDRDHWLRRLEKLLKRPGDEGPVLTVLFDGMNQEPSVPWLQILKGFQAETFEGRIRVILSTRNHHLDNRLQRLRGLIAPAVFVQVDPYDVSPGGELDQMLAFEGLKQGDLPPDLIALSRTPRLFKLVIRFRERLVEAGQVTVHRVLWEYGRDTFGDRAGKSFSEDDWRAWLQEIACHYRDGVRDFSLRTLGETTTRPDLTDREVFARLSDIIDGQFTTSGSAGKLQLKPAVVSHALGAALLSQLDAALPTTFATVETALTQWLDPITGLDERAEILRAAVSILVERGGPTATPVAGVLVTAWLQTQNVTEAHRRELSGLATSLPEALLDAIEQSREHTHASARLWAVNALRSIPRSNASVLSVIVERVCRWFSIVSRDVEALDPQFEDADRQRSRRFLTRVGVDASGSLKVLGRELEFVDRDDGILGQTAPSLLEGFPLTPAAVVFETAAIAMAAGGRNQSWDGLNWLCLLNEVDPAETTNALRALSVAVRARTPEALVNPALPSRAAALLLWLTGEEADETAAVAIDPGLDRSLQYERDYLPHPSRSFFPLERRHVENVLNDTGVGPRARIQRTRDLWLDPAFAPPAAFVDEVRAAAASIDVDKLYRQRHYTVEEHDFEELEPALARCAPDLLADLLRRKLQNLATCPPSSRYGAAIQSTAHLVLAQEREGAAARALRLSSPEREEGNELFAANHLLMLELHERDALIQLKTLIEADLKNILVDLGVILRKPEPADVDTLIARFGTGSAAQQRTLLILLSQHEIALSEAACSWLMNVAEGSDENLRRFAYRALAGADATRFGRALLALNWHWSAEAEHWINHYGSGALIAAAGALPFEQVAPRLAPWRLLEAARQRGGDPAEIRLAIDIASSFLAAEKGHAPDVDPPLTVDRTDEDSGLLRFSVTPGPTELHRAFTGEAQAKVYKRARDIAVELIHAAQRSGASLLLANIEAKDFAPVLRHAPDLVELWLEGMSGPTSDFKRRVGLAETAYLALCEALLEHDAHAGAALWRSLRETLETRYIGLARVDELIHIPFRAPDTAEVDALRAELLDLRCCHTDKGLLEVALAATLNGKTGWLARAIEADKASLLAWRRKRGVVLDGFRTGNSLPVSDAWPDGEIRTSHEELRRKSARSRYTEACADHWWRTYRAARSHEESYAAWVLFLRSADRRAWNWLNQSMLPGNGNDDFFRLKMVHAHLNRSNLRRAMKEREDKFDKNFLGRRIFEGLGPWLKEPD
ncbi:hypothetical protein [Hyalangium rubrum]|uniref:NACHT domain-containing protein n=1 Tax=Hyalangium rubrum TaxID=3103134 RepID=A0ABU5H8P0_9BACT|nr:hypothetical protein [Hyalangium sp. s54d21]MDY7229137.1 hypothetical protein [Hyalangium sp. s54d21]